MLQVDYKFRLQQTTKYNKHSVINVIRKDRMEIIPYT